MTAFRSLNAMTASCRKGLLATLKVDALQSNATKALVDDIRFILYKLVDCAPAEAINKFTIRQPAFAGGLRACRSH